jgi:GAF domain-containing protein
MNIQKSVLVPLTVGDITLGEMGVMNRLNGDFGEEDVQLLSAIAIQIAAALDRIRLYEATGQNLSRRLLELDAISRVSNELAQTLDLEPVLDVIRHEAIRATDADGTTIPLLTPSSDWHDEDLPQQATVGRTPRCGRQRTSKWKPSAARKKR